MSLMARTGLHVPVTLRFVRSEDRYSVYKDPDGDEVFLAHGTGLRMYECLDDMLDEGTLTDWADEYKRSLPYYYSTLDGFQEWLRERLVWEHEADNIGQCANCNDYEFTDDLFCIKGGDRVCESCFESYLECSHCEEYEHNEYMSYVEGRGSICEHCRDYYYSWCEDCEEYYHDDDRSEHDHTGCDCEPPAGLRFTMPFAGQDPLGNDERRRISLPAGVISEEGITQIAVLLRRHGDEFVDWVTGTGFEERRPWCDLANRLHEIGETWQAKDGNYTKRLSRFAYKNFQIKVPPEIMTEVGNIASAHSRAVDFDIEFTRDLNMSAEDFYHEDSCWWGSYSDSRCALKTNGGLGLRSFRPDSSWSEVTGRAWVMPLVVDLHGDLQPTFRTMEADAFIVFNGYGDLSGYTPARIVSHMTGWTYRKVNFYGSPMYVNAESGYLVAPEEIAAPYTDGSISINLETHSNLYAREHQKELTIVA